MLGFVLVGLSACSGGGTTTGDIVPKTTTSSPTSFPDLGAELVVTDAHTHGFDAAWVIPSSPLQAGLDATIDWANVTLDAYEVERDPAAFDTVVLVRAAASRTEVADLLAVDQLDAVIEDQWEASARGLTEIRLSALSGFDPAVSLVEDPDATLLFALCDRAGDRLDVRSAVIVEPDPEVAGTVLTVPNAVTRVTWTAELDGDTLRTQTGYDDYPLDWSAVTTDGYGQPFDPARADELFLARFDGVDEADDLTGILLGIDAAAAEIGTAPLSGQTSAALSELGGVGALQAGVYLVGVRCTTCWGPAPLWAAGLEVRD